MSQTILYKMEGVCMDIKAKQPKAYQPTRLEVAKTVTLVALIVAIAAFIAGNAYANGQRASLDQAVSNAVQAQQPSK